MAVKPVSGEIKAQPLNDNFSYLDSKVEQVNGGPKETFTSFQDLQSKYPNGSNSAMLVTDEKGDNGYLYTWSGSNWVKGALYQPQGIANLAVDKEKIALNTLSATRLEYLPGLGKTGKNLFNKDTILDDSTLNTHGQTQKNPYPDVPFVVSDYIKVNPTRVYKRTALDTAWFYTIDGLPISEIEGVQFKVPDNVEFCRFTIKEKDIDSFMVFEGTADIAYEPFKVFNDSNAFEEASIDVKFLAQTVLEPELGKNLFDSNSTLKNSYVSAVNGKINPLKNYQASDFIQLEAETDYVKNNTQQFAFYSDKTVESFVSGVTSGNIVKLPTGAKYVRLTLKDAEADSLQLEKGSVSTAFEAYGKYIQEHQLAPQIVNKLNDTISDIDFSVQLPSTIYLTVNEEFQIYWFNVISNYQKMHEAGVSVRVVDSTNTILGTIGEDTGDMWRYTPTSSGVRKITIRVVNDSTQEIINSKDVTLEAKSNLSVSLSKTMVTIGDSFTDGFGISKYFHDFVSSDPNKTLNMIGLNDSGKVGVKDNAWSGQSYKWFYGNDRGYLRSDRPLEDAFWDSGWGKGEANGWTEGQTYADLTEAQKAHGFTKNEFYNPAIQKFDFNYFMSTYMANAHVDGVIFILGLNDSIWENPTTLKNNLSVYKTRLDEMFNSIFAYDANINIMISLVTPQQQKDSFMRTYGTTANPWLTDSRAKRSQEIWNQFILETYDTLEWKNKGLNVMATNAHFNTEYGLLTREIAPVKFDNTIKQRITRDVHPTEVGAKYIADCIRNNINGVIFD